MFSVKDFLNEKYPGSSVTPSKYNDCSNICLSIDARNSLSNYLEKNANGFYTRLHYEQKNTVCRFNKKVDISEKVYPYYEDIDINHPLIRWMIDMLKNDRIYNSGCSCLSVKTSDFPDSVKLEAGCYTYIIHKWKVSGIRNVNELHYYLCNNRTQEILNNEEAESILIQLLLSGNSYSSNLIDDEKFNSSLDSLGILDEKAWNDFGTFSTEQRTQNAMLFREQEQYINHTADIKLKKIKETIANIINNNTYDIKKKETILRMHQGRADKVQQDRTDKIRRLEEKLDCSPVTEEISMGILVVLES